MIKKLLFSLLFGLLMITVGQASHLMGGEITWKCQANGSFKFTMKIYRDCNGITFTGTGVSLSTTHPSVPSIPMTLVTSTDISPQGPGCFPCDHPNNNPGETREFILESGDVFLPGTPPAQGWVFYWGSCCRNAAITNLATPSSDGFTLRAIMFPYNGQNTNPCFDSSPFFAERPNVIMCTRNTFKYNHNAVDVELDSLVYDWGQPLDDGNWQPPLVAFNPPYTFNNPLPGPTQHPSNIGAVMNPQTGEVSFTSFTQGAFVVLTKVTAYKCGVKVAEIYREIQIILMDCIINPGPPAVYNTDPDVNAPFPDPVTGLFTKYDTTVCVGDTVSFFLNATDFELTPLGTPQTVTITASGSQFGAGYTSTTNGCLNPPCATLTPPPPISAQFGVGVTFNWVTDCAHLGKDTLCTSISNAYTFVIRAQDDFCPAPAMNFSTIVIRVKTDSIGPPSLRCIQVNTDNSALLTWEPPPNNMTDCELRSFHSYDIYSSTSPGGPYLFVDSVVGDPTITSYLHANSNANNQSIYYFVSARWGCDKFSLNPNVSQSDTLQSIFLTVTNANPEIAVLNWNQMHIPNIPTASGIYNIYKKKGVNGTWGLIGSTTLLTYSDSAKVCNDSVFYRIEMEDASGCVSVSNVDGNLFQAQNITIDAPSLRCLAVDEPSGNITLTWVLPTDTAEYFDQYEIWHSSSSAGPFSLIHSTDIFNTTSYTHTGANGNVQSQYYYIKVVAGCDSLNVATSPASDTLRSIYLTVGNTNPQVAVLNWNALHVPNLPTSTGMYLIYRKIGVSGSWSLIDSTANLTYSDNLSLCGDSVFYRIEIGDTSGCFSKSNEDGNWFQLNTPNITPPLLRCLAVNPTGSITLTWITTPDTGQFFSAYEVYHSTNLAGPYTLVNTVNNYNTTTYTHVGATGNTQINYYFIKTVAGCDATNLFTSSGSDTLASIYLTVTPSPGFASLAWNALHNPNLPTTQLPYKIFRNNGAGWLQIGTSNTLNYVDTITQCDVLLSYRVEIPDASGCVSVSNVAADTFSYQPPLIASPSLRCVAVQTNGNVTLTWVVPPDPLNLFDKYLIYHSTGGPFTVLDSIMVYGQTSYTHTGANGNSQVNSYYIVSYSGCPNSALPSPTPSATLNSMLLNATPSVGFANLSWNALATPLPATTQLPYKIFRNDGSGWVQIGTSATTNYTDTITQCDVPLSYRVEIPDASGCVSISSIDSDTFTFQPPLIASPSLRCVAVQTNGDVTLTWVIPPDPDNWFRKYLIYHSTGGPFSILDSVMVYGQTSYTHTGANGNSQVNSYYIVSYSGCPNSSQPSPAPSATLNSMLLSATPSMGFANLAWNALATPLPATAQLPYKIFRNDGSGWVQIGTSVTTTYTDTITQCDVPLSYRVEIPDASGCVSISSVDNDIFTYQPPLIASPSLRCVAVQTNGDVTLTWVIPPDPDNWFTKYLIYHSTGGPFTVLDSVTTYNQATYTHIGANGNNQVNSYYLVSYSGCPNSAQPSPTPSATLNSMLLTATPSLGFATLTWNALSTPLPSTSAGFYKIFKNDGSGWTQIGTTSSLTYVDTISDCNIPLDYRVEIDDASGCTSVSSVASDVFTYLGDVIDNPSFRCVSVQANGDVVLNWITPSDPTNFFAGYDIFHSTGAGFSRLATVNTYNQSTYTHAGANGQNTVNSYYLVSLSGCTGTEFSGSSDTLSSMLVSAVPSLGFANLTWNPMHSPNPFIPTSSGIYEIWRNYDNQGWNQIGTTTGEAYMDTISDCNVPISYRVEIADASGCKSVSSMDNDIFTYLGEIVDAPSVRCVIVEPNGDVTLNWIAPQDPEGFFSDYQLYHSNSASGPYSLLGSLNTLSQTAYTHAGANGQNAVNYYHVITRSGCTGTEESIPSDTLASMLLGVNNLSGIAQLNWNPIHAPNLPTSSGTYKIYREYPLGTWTLLASTPQTNYLDTITVCSADINYRIELDDASGCTSVSSIDGDLFQDLTPPAVPLIDTVSVDPQTGIVSIGWNVNPSGDTQGYIIYLYNGASYDSIASVSGINNVGFVNSASNANNLIETYAIAAYDSCGNLSPYSSPHNTILTDSYLDICTSSNIISWNAYQNMNSGLLHYAIYASINGGPYTLVSTVDGNTTTYAHSGLVPNVNYCYYIQAVSGDGLLTASSTLTCEFSRILTDPTFNYLKVATVAGENHVLIQAYIDTLADVSAYRIERSRSLNGPYSSVGQVAPPLNSDIISFTDATASTGATSYYYRVIVVDSCGNDKFTSNIGRTVHLQASADDFFRNHLSWNDYEEWIGAVESYNIYRVIDGVWETAPIANVPFGINNYIDDVSRYYESNARFCYVVEAIQGVDTIYAFTDTSLSNEACAIQPVKFYTPNAFTPGGSNPVFKPVQIFINVNSYTFTVFNRWGEKIFETNDPDKGWDGSFEGEEAPQGVYVYKVEFKGVNESEFLRRGTFTLLR